LYHILSMTTTHTRQQDRAISLLKQQGIVRLSELTEAGITATTVSRMKEKGLIHQLRRGLYQLPDASVGANHSLAEAAKIVSKGVICLTSALAFHELTDTIPSHIWIAIGPKDRRPKTDDPLLQIVRFTPLLLSEGVKEHKIEGVQVKITEPARTIVDLFRYRRSAGTRYQKSPGLNLALEGLRKALRERKATPAEIARYANDVGIWKIIQPYMDAMLANV
jgi:predicted transcriptional regulator of viral defense system